jgi:MFS family permease
MGFEYAKRLSPLYIATLFVRTSWGIGSVVLYYYLGVPDETSRFLYGIIVAASPAAELVTVSPAGLYIDRHGRRHILILGLGLGALSLFLFTLTKNPYWAFGVNIIHGVASAFILVSSLALMGDNVHQETRGREMGVFDAMNMFGWIMGFALGFALSEFFKPFYAGGLIVAGGILLTGFLYAWVYLAESEVRRQTHLPITAILTVMKRKTILLLILPWFILYIVIGAILAFLPEGQKIVALPPYLFAAGVFGAGVALMISQISYGKKSDKYGRGPIMLVGAVGLTGLMILFGVAILSVPAGTPRDQMMSYIIEELKKYWPVILIFGACALAFGPSALASLVDNADEDKRGTTMAIYSFVITLGMTIGPVVVGWLWDRVGPVGVMGFVILMGACMLVLTLLKYQSDRSKNQIEKV